MARQGKGLVENQKKKMPSFKMQSSRHVQTTNGENHFFSFLHSLFMVFPIKSEVFERFFFSLKKLEEQIGRWPI